MASPRQPRGALVLEEMARELLRSPASQGDYGVLLHPVDKFGTG